MTDNENVPAAEASLESWAEIGGDPYALAQVWLDEAVETEPNDPNAMALATADASGLPSVRMVLLKEIEPAGLVFYTNYESAKGRDLAVNAQAAIVIHWKSLRRQIRARGRVERAEGPQADAYFESRSYQSRIGAWASAQSRPLSSRAALVAEAALYAARYPFNPPRPPHWGGFRLAASEFEFWRDGAYRLHDRFRWRRDGAGWRAERLNP